MVDIESEEIVEFEAVSGLTVLKTFTSGLVETGTGLKFGLLSTAGAVPTHDTGSNLADSDERDWESFGAVICVLVEDPTGDMFSFPVADDVGTRGV